MKVSKYGLAGEHWAIGIACGMSSWVVAVLFKLIPDTWCPQLGKKEKNPLKDNKNNVLNLRRSRSSSFKK